MQIEEHAGEATTYFMPKVDAPYVEIKDLSKYDGQKVALRGWLMHHRDKKKLQFLVLRDGTGTVQAVAFQDDLPAGKWDLFRDLTQESSIVVTGTVRKDDRAPGGYELSVSDLEVFQLAAPDYPVQPKEHTVGFLMEHRHLWLRSNKQRAVLRIRAEVIKAARDYLDNNGFVLVDTPILTPAACEGTSTLFETDYFGTPAYLAQSGQLYNEADIAAFGKVYCFGPTFRAEKSKTRRHLTEFWMVEPEVAYMDLDGDMELMEQFVSHVVQTALAKHRKEIQTVLERDVTALEKVVPPFPRITYTEAVEVIQKAGHPMKWGDDIGGDEETIVAKQFDRPVMVHRYPAEMKAFYFKKDPKDAKVALGCDVLAPEGYGEIIGGGQREDDLATLEAAIEHHKLPKEAFEWYLDVRRYGSVPHAGFGMGVERCVAWICGLHHVRETIPFARMMERITP
jgi:asparaginyl-tRNA synthetase